MITLTFRQNGEPQDVLCAHASNILNHVDFVTGLGCFDEGINVYAKVGPSAVPEAIRILDEKRLHIDRLSLTRPSLDDVFLKVTGRKIRDDGPVRNWRAGVMLGGRGGTLGGGRRRG